MAQIAEAAGLQQSSIYYWFRSKSDILGLDPRAGEPDPAGHRRAGADGRRARWPMRLHRLRARGRAGAVRLPVRHQRDPPPGPARRPRTSPPTGRSGAASTTRSRRWSPRASRRGELRPVDARLAARTLLAGDEATQNWFRSDRRAGYAAEEVADHAAEVDASARCWPTRRRSRPCGPRRWPRSSADAQSSPLAPPAVALGGEGRLLLGAEGGDAVGLGVEEAPGGRPRRKVVGSIVEVELAGLGRGPQVEQLVGLDRVEADLVEGAQQPRHVGLVARASGRRGTRPARCGRRTGSRPGPPCRTRRGRRRRCRRRSPGSTCGPGCTSW